MDHCSVQVISSGLIICESRDLTCLCENWDNSLKLQSEPVSMVQFTFYEKRFGGYLVNQPLYFFRCYYEYTKVEKKKRAPPCCECSKILKTSPQQHMLCAVINKLVYPEFSLYTVYWLMSAKHSSVADNTFPNNLIVKVKCQNWVQKGQPKENYRRQ
jgi:hypothetical protein